MAQRRARTYHNGGIQLPLPGTTPVSDWARPSELPDLRRCERIALDRETRDEGLASGWGPGWAKGADGGYICGTAVAWREGDAVRAAYLPVRHDDTDCFSPEQVRQWEIDHQQAGVTFVMQNAPYDCGWGHAEGVPIPPLIDDTVAMANMIDEQRYSYELNALCAWWGIPGKDESLLREAMASYSWPARTERELKQNMWRLPARYVGPYAEQDAAATLQLAELMDPEIDRQGTRAAYQLEMDLLPCVHEMRRRGVRVDLDAAERATGVFRAKRAQALRDLSEHLGRTTGIDNIRRNEWLEETFTHHGVAFPRGQGKLQDRGNFDAKWMRRVNHWLPRLVCRAKAAEDAAEKFLQTYIVGYAHRGRLHATINQFRGEDGGTRTFRFSYAEPPLQQIPVRGEDAAELIRGVFLPEEDEWWDRVDYSQQEYRLIVHYAERLGLTRASIAAQRYRDDPETDYHDMVVDMTGLERKPAKDTNFAKSYGAGIPKFAAMIDKSEEEARRIMAQYDAELPFVRELFELCQRSAEERGYVLLLDRARIHFNAWEPTWLDRDERARGFRPGSSYKMNACSLEEAQARVAQMGHPWYRKRLRRADCRKAMNAKIQGSAARQTKMAMRACWRAGHVPLLQLHDELGFSVREERQGIEASAIMREIVKLNVPMLAESEYGRSWGDAKHSWSERGEAAT